jgi:uncharacterized RDD family membrane protein YckC
MENITLETQRPYAGFWLRVAACIIDSILLSFIQFILVLPVMGFFGFAGLKAAEDLDAEGMSDDEMLGFAAGMIGSMLIIWLIFILVQWLYYALMESSSRQATVGKLAVGIVVTDMNGGRVSFLRASGRFFGKIISSAILCIGYLMAGFTEKKQALHDMIASTLVIKK